MKLAIVVSKFNSEITRGLLDGCVEFLREKHVEQSLSDIFEAPGAFEIPLVAKHLAQTGRYQGVICLGCIIQGDTAHFEYISLGASWGIQSASLESGIPISFGILTTYTEEQAYARSRPDAHNKGREAAAACLETVQLLERIAKNR